MDSISLIISVFKNTTIILWSYWWIWLPVVLVLAAFQAFKDLKRSEYLAGLKWVTLEIKIPQEILKSPKSMEQIFSALHVVSGDVKSWRETLDKGGIMAAWNYQWGKVGDVTSFEIVSLGGVIHFYIRCLEQYRNLIEAQIYGYFSDAEIFLTTDYLTELPAALPNEQMDLASGEVILAKEDAYPIKTYPEFEEQGAGKDDPKRVDPLASLVESMALMIPGEVLGLQILVSGTEKGKDIQPVIDKIMEKPAKPRNDALDQILSFIDSLFGATPTVPEKKDEKSFSQLGPGKQDIIKAIEKAAAKLPFKVGIRFLYVAPKDRFNKGRPAGVFASFKQFSTMNLNAFKPGFSSDAKGRNKEYKSYVNKVTLFKRYSSRSQLDKPFTLNSEELATIYHFPDAGVVSGALPRVEAKKGEPPSGLPTA
ncbi:hypothetical protein KW791_02725 [Candidatus Parcubacteria bacterium]|nr:hypothetical protein [Candidatus Parcubacteria bacterium]